MLPPHPAMNCKNCGKPVTYLPIDEGGMLVHKNGLFVCYFISNLPPGVIQTGPHAEESDA